MVTYGANQSAYYIPGRKNFMILFPPKAGIIETGIKETHQVRQIVTVPQPDLLES